MTGTRSIDLPAASLQRLMRHLVFALLVSLYVLYGAQNWHHYAAALMCAAWIRHGGRLGSAV